MLPELDHGPAHEGVIYNDLLYSAITVRVKYSLIQRFYNIVMSYDRRELRVEKECEDNLNTRIEHISSKKQKNSVDNNFLQTRREPF